MTILSNHDYGANAPRPLANVPSLSNAQTARSLTEANDRGALSTLAADGHPFGSIVQYTLDTMGEPVMLLSDLAEHSKNIHVDGRASLLVSVAPQAGDDPMSLARVTLIGRLHRVPQTELTVLRDPYLEAHPFAKHYVNFGDFSFWRLELGTVRYVGGYGRMSWIETDDYHSAAPDPLARHAAAIVSHMNTDHADACLSYVRSFAAIEDAVSARMIGADHLGIDLIADTSHGIQPVRIAFNEPVDSPNSARHALMAMLERTHSMPSSHNNASS